MATWGLDAATLSTLGSLDSVLDWAGVVPDGSFRASVLAAFGGPTVPRDLASISAEELEAVLTGLTISDAGTDTPATPVQRGKVRAAHAACRMMAGLPVVGLMAPAPPGPVPPAPPPLKKVKLSALVD